MRKLSRLLKDKPLTQGVIGNAIFQTLWQAGSAVISYIAANSAYIQGVPIYLAILLGVVIFLLMLVAAYLIKSLIARPIGSQVEITNEGRVSETAKQQGHALDISASASRSSALELAAASKGTFSQSSDKTKLEIQLNDSIFPFYRIGIRNNGTSVARGVEVWLERVWGQWLGYTIEDHLPHRLSTRDTKERRSDINPGREEVFEFVTSSLGERDKGIRLDIDGIKINPTRNAREPADYLTVRKGEYVHFWIRVSCANADDETAVFFAQQFEHSIIVYQL
jgi:hypothetical protein